MRIDSPLPTPDVGSGVHQTGEGVEVAEGSTVELASVAVTLDIVVSYKNENNGRGSRKISWLRTGELSCAVKSREQTSAEEDAGELAWRKKQERASNLGKQARSSTYMRKAP
jgi:hypothetical protein